MSNENKAKEKQGVRWGVFLPAFLIIVRNGTKKTVKQAAVFKKKMPERIIYGEDQMSVGRVD